MVISSIRSWMLRGMVLLALVPPLFLVVGQVSLVVRPWLTSLSRVHVAQPVVQVTTAFATGVQRINQLDPAQYQSYQEYTAWSPSTCSAASMTEVLNAYGGHYRLTDILAVERRIGAISAQEGLLGDVQIERTMQQFGFSVSWGYALSLDQVIATANAGHPVIVSFPPALWAGGHLLVVTGGTATTVRVADSSSYNMQVLTRARFLHYWGGFSAVATPVTPVFGMSVVGGPSLSPGVMNAVLARVSSPAEGTGQALYDLSVQYGIDDAFALAVFQHESTYGLYGAGSVNHSLGNIICAGYATCDGRFRFYATWEEGYVDFYRLITREYLPRGLSTVQTIMPVYAPSSENDVGLYIRSVVSSMQAYRALQASSK